MQQFWYEDFSRNFIHPKVDPGRPWTLLCYRKPLTLTETDVCRVNLKMNKKNRQLFLLMVRQTQSNDLLFRWYRESLNFFTKFPGFFPSSKQNQNIQKVPSHEQIIFFAVHTLKFEIFQTTGKNEKKPHQILRLVL